MAREGDQAIEAGTNGRGTPGGGFNVGHVLAGEWLAYTVDVKEAGTYDLDLRLSVWSGGGRLHVELDGKDASGQVDVPGTGDWSKWTTVTVKGVRLGGGRQSMRVVFDAAAGRWGERRICLEPQLVHIAPRGRLTSATGPRG